MTMFLACGAYHGLLCIIHIMRRSNLIRGMRDSGELPERREGIESGTIQELSRIYQELEILG